MSNGSVSLVTAAQPNAIHGTSNVLAVARGPPVFRVDAVPPPNIGFGLRQAIGSAKMKVFGRGHAAHGGAQALEVRRAGPDVVHASGIPQVRGGEIAPASFRSSGNPR